MGEPVRHFLPEEPTDIELIIHKNDGAEIWDFCSIEHLFQYLKEESMRITDDMVSE